MKCGIITCITAKIRRITLNMAEFRKIAAFIASGAMLLSVVSCGKKVSDAEIAHTTETTAAVTETVTETTAPTTAASTTVTTVVTTAPQPPENLVLSGKESVGVYEEITISDFITDKNVELAEPEKLLDVAEIGEHEIAVKYRGYIQREQRIADKILKLENVVIPDNFDFLKVTSLSIESRQKLMKHRPTTIAQASRIPGVSPADVSVLLVYFGR